MGAGSSVPPLPSEKSAAGLAGRPANVDHQGGVQWLLTVVDKEKEEKAWLAKKFEDKCMEAWLATEHPDTEPAQGGFSDEQDRALVPRKIQPCPVRGWHRAYVSTSAKTEGGLDTN
eukprot:g20130.t1